MKKILLLSAAIVYMSASLFGQISIPDFDANAKVEPIDSLVFSVQYQVTMIENPEEPDKKADEVMMLRVGRNVSEYFSYTSFVADSILRTKVRDTGSGRRIVQTELGKLAFGKISHRIYKNHPQGKMTLFDRIATDNFAVVEQMPKIEWQILPDTATVCGYLCQKATTSLYGRDYEVWFTTEIPQRDGPWKLHGLPGLILKAEDSQKHYTFVCTGIEQARTPQAIVISSASRRNISRTELNKLYERFNADPMAYLKTNAPNLKIMVQNESGEEIRKITRPHNPIELK